ncbi:MAG: response regulator [Rhodocyclaceae bacterium]|nr:response regulator [Rhodocyclaceae bacterium]
MAHVLLVDDEELNLEILLEYFDDEPDFTLETAADGEIAWEMLQDDSKQFDLILLDRMMPRLDGIGLLRRMMGVPRLALIPVVLQTAAGSAEQVREGMEAGAYYYLTKPYRRDALLAIAHSAITDARSRRSLRHQLHEHIGALQFLSHGQFRVRTIDEASQLAAFIAQACPNPEASVLGISELLVNGVEHGNLGISYDDKASLKLNDNWREEIDRRTALPENSSKRVILDFQRDGKRITLRFTDEGSGFAWQDYLEMNPERACDPNGRGIALARMLSFSKIHYEGCGNVAVATLTDPSDGQSA